MILIFLKGNRETLWNLPRARKIDVRKELLAFHKRNYSANLMNLSVIGNQGLDELQSLVEKMFTAVQNKNIPLPKWLESPYGPNEIGKWAKLVPVKDLRQITIMFPIRDTTEFYRTGLIRTLF